MTETSESIEPSAAGHRQRLRERFKKGGLSALADYEVIELILTLGTPRRDCKPAAKAAIKRFKTFRGVLEASAAELEEVEGIGPANSIGIRLVAEAAREFLKERAVEHPVCGTAQQVYDYLYASMGGLKKEVFKVLYLDSQNRIIEIVDLFQGTVNASAVWVRDVVEGALRLHATGMIFVHNHPSGTITPSQPDKDITRDLVFAAATMNIKSQDHIIIGDNKYYSFNADGLMDRYAAEFRGLRGKSN